MIRNINIPISTSPQAIESILVLLGFQDVSRQAWRAYFVGAKPQFEQRLINFRPENVAKKTHLKVTSEYLLEPEYDEQALMEQSFVVSNVAKFVRSVAFWVQLGIPETDGWAPQIQNVQSDSGVPLFDVVEYRRKILVGTSS